MAPNGIPTVAELEAHIGDTGPDQRAALKLILEGILDMVSRRAAGVYLGPAKSITVLLAGGQGRRTRLYYQPAEQPRGKEVVYLPSPPAPADEGGNPVTLVEVRDDPGGDWRILSTSEWMLEGRLLRRPHGVPWPPFAPAVRVTYRAGYDAISPMPASVALGVLDAAAAEWRQRHRSQPGIEILEPGSAPQMPRTFWMAVTAVTPPPETI